MYDSQLTFSLALWEPSFNEKQVGQFCGLTWIIPQNPNQLSPVEQTGSASVPFTRFWSTTWAEAVHSISSRAEGTGQLSEGFRIGMLVYRMGKNLLGRIWQTSETKVLFIREPSLHSFECLFSVLLSKTLT